MKWQTSVKVNKAKSLFNYSNRFCSLGSCFANEIGSKMKAVLLNCETNPLGILFNPISLVQLIEKAVEESFFSKDEFFLHQDLWKHALIQSHLASTDLNSSLENGNRMLMKLRNSIKESDFLILTLGSAFVYERKDTGRIVGHNHKLPLQIFIKRLLSVSEIVESLHRALEGLKTFNPSLKVCFTVSPVRHLRDGLHENQLSKSSLLLAINELERLVTNLSYFPSYEILLDELRDYRYYKEDLSHPSKEAVQYIWEIFLENYFEESVAKKSLEVEKIHAGLSHNPNHTDTQSYRRFKRTLKQSILEIQSEGVNIQPLLNKYESLK